MEIKKILYCSGVLFQPVYANLLHSGVLETFWRNTAPVFVPSMLLITQYYDSYIFKVLIYIFNDPKRESEDENILTSTMMNARSTTKYQNIVLFKTQWKIG